MLLALGIALVAYLVGLGALLVVGRRADARALSRLIPDCVVLVRRLMGDPRVPRRRKVVLVAALAYVAVPIDLVPEFIPVVGYLDDAVIVALALRSVLKGAGAPVVAEHWPGPEQSLAVLLSLTRPRWPSAATSAVAMAVGAWGLAVCIWFDIADNCDTCGEDDPLLLVSSRLAAVTLGLAGAAGLIRRLRAP